MVFGVSTSARRGLGAAIAVAGMLALAAVVGGCGGDDSETTTPDEGGGENLELAKPKEDVDEARKRIAKTLATDDCKQINELNPVGRPSLSSKARCDYLRRLDGLEVSGAKAYGDAGAVIDYEIAERTYSAVLIRDSDGLYHVAFFNPYGVEKTVGTKYAKTFDQTANKTLEALKKRDCKAYSEVLFRRFGIGRQDDKVICEFVENSPIARQLEAFPDAEFKSSGGNADYAFYTLATPATHWTLVFARQADRKGQPSELDLPDDSATYAYVAAYPTALREPPAESGEGSEDGGSEN